jgi:hypothetical protein
MKSTQNFTTNTTKQLDIIIKKRAADFYLATILVYGTFDGATVAYYLSPDDGSTLVALKDLTGASISSTAADNVNVQLGNSTHLDDYMSLYATTTGSGGSTNITVDVFNNR